MDDKIEARVRSSFARQRVMENIGAVLSQACLTHRCTERGRISCLLWLTFGSCRLRVSRLGRCACSFGFRKQRSLA
jgi:hypothetical protein